MGNQAVPGYADVWGKHATFIGDHTGPVNYTTGGEMIRKKNLGLRSIDWFATAGLDDSGVYSFISYTTGVGIRETWVLKWLVQSTGVEVPNGTNLSAFKVRIFAVGG
jgi:hypothetical protein